jgi:hypothetical protein
MAAWKLERKLTIIAADCTFIAVFAIGRNSEVKDHIRQADLVFIRTLG